MSKKANSKNERMSVSDPGEKIEWGGDSEPRKNERVPSSANWLPSPHNSKRVFGSMGGTHWLAGEGAGGVNSDERTEALIL